jgi:ribosomal protein S18 acetylase RimI-like enzyme
LNPVGEQTAMDLRIRPMRGDDVDFAAALTAAEGWVTESHEEFDDFRQHDPAGCLLAEWRGRPAGVCVATAYGAGGFLGEMIIDRSMRGLALGPPLFERSLGHLRNRGCQAVSLDGVPRAVPYYASLGFRPRCRSLRLTGRPAPGRAKGVRPMRAEDLPHVFAIDRQAFNGDRSFFLGRRHAQAPELSLVLIGNERIAGYLFGRRRPPYVWAGPLWSETGPNGAEALLTAFAGACGEVKIMAGVLEENEAATALLNGMGFRPRPRPSRRMVLGDESAAVGQAQGLFLIGTAAKG